MPERREPIILWCGRFTNPDGYGTVSRNHLRGLELAGARIAALDTRTLRPVGAAWDDRLELRRGATLEVRALDPDDTVVVVWHERPDQYPRVRVHGRARLVGHSVFETEGLPHGWAPLMTAMDEIWVATDFNRRTFSAGGVPDFLLRNVPHSLDTRRYPVRPLRDDNRLDIVTVCSGLQRRDLALGFRAFLRAFSLQENVRYVVKLRDRPADLEAAHRLLRTSVREIGGDAAERAKRIELVAEDFDPDAMIDLYASSDVYLSVERVNGWDLPTMEAMACGKPTVAFDFGGSTEFTNTEVAVRLGVSERREPIPPYATHAFYESDTWPAVDESLLVDALREMLDPEKRRRIGKAAQGHIRDHFDVGVVGARVRASLSDLDLTDFRGPERAVIVIGHEPVWRRSSPTTRTEQVERLVAVRRRVVRGAIARLRGRRTSFLPVEQPSGVPGGPRAAVRRAVATAARSLRRSILRRRPSESKRHVAAVADIQTAAHDPDQSWTDDDLADRRLAFGRQPLIPVGTEEQAALQSVADRYRGERCFILGNGPSLNRLDLAKLASEYTFGVNKIYLLYDRIDWRPTFYTLLDWRVGPEIAPEIDRMDGSIKFLPNRFRGLFPGGDDTFWFSTRPVLDGLDDQFRPSIVDGVPSKGTILVTAIQIAFHLGFRDIVLIGVDASYRIPKTVRQSGPDRFGSGIKLNLESTQDDDPNHFDPTYFGKGARWHDPNVDEMVRQFRQMRKGIEYHGGRIRNATDGGQLDVFERVSFDSLFRPNLMSGPGLDW